MAEFLFLSRRIPAVGIFLNCTMFLCYRYVYLLQPGGLPNPPQPLHRFQKAEARQHRPQQPLRPRDYERRPVFPAPADSGCSPEFAAQQFRKIKARRKARHGVHPERHSPAEAPPADQRTSLRHHQALRRRPSFPLQRQGKGLRRIRALGTELQHLKSHRHLRRRSETHRTLSQQRCSFFRDTVRQRRH